MSSTELPILIVDDEVEIRETLAALLQSKEIAVISAANGAEAYQLMESRSKDHGPLSVRMVISDWMMPELSGIDLLVKMRNSAFKEIPFLLMSGAVTQNQLMDAAKFGTDGILLKPFSIDALLHEITLTEERRLRKQLG